MGALYKKNSKDVIYRYNISVVIPNWNGLNYLKACLLSLRNQTLNNFEVIVVDNGSEDGSVRFIKAEYPWVNLIELPQNLGFAVACNCGIKSAQGEYIAILNNDTEVEPRWLENLFRTAKGDEKIGMVASKILLSLETREIDSVGMLIYPDGIGRQRGRGKIDDGEFSLEEEILYPSACAALYKREMISEIGYFDEHFFAYCEDTDLGLRGRRAGWKAVLAPDAVVLHKYSKTGGGYSLFKAIHVERNRIWVGIKNFPFLWILKMPYYTILRYVVQMYSMVSHRGSTARLRETQTLKDIVSIAVRAYLSAIKGIPSMVRKRKTIKSVNSKREFTSLLRRYRISVRELILHD